VNVGQQLERWSVLQPCLVQGIVHRDGVPFLCAAGEGTQGQRQRERERPSQSDQEPEKCDFEGEEGGVLTHLGTVAETR